jgi:hypothetical protein
VRAHRPLRAMNTQVVAKISVPVTIVAVDTSLTDE